MARREVRGVNGGHRLKYKKEFIERLRRMMKTKQVSGKMVKKRSC